MIGSPENRMDADVSAAPDLIDWSVYSEHYDQLCAANPAYQEMLLDVSSRIEEWALPDSAEICDFGAGTGSFVLALASKLKRANFHHIDSDKGMVSAATRKYQEAGLNVRVYNEDLREFSTAPGKFDLAICVNTIYAIPEHQKVLEDMRQWTKPGGRLYIVDFGRKVELLDWAIYILRNRVKDLGLRQTISWYRENAENLAQNRRGAKAQASGSYWLHSTQEFGEALSKAGWVIEELDTCYRDCCDRAVCLNPL